MRYRLVLSPRFLLINVRGLNVHSPLSKSICCDFVRQDMYARRTTVIVNRLTRKHRAFSFVRQTYNHLSRPDRPVAVSNYQHDVLDVVPNCSDKPIRAISYHYGTMMMYRCEQNIILTIAIEFQLNRIIAPYCVSTMR